MKLKEKIWVNTCSRGSKLSFALQLEDITYTLKIKNKNVFQNKIITKSKPLHIIETLYIIIIRK